MHLGIDTRMHVVTHVSFFSEPAAGRWFLLLRIPALELRRFFHFFVFPISSESLGVWFSQSPDCLLASERVLRPSLAFSPGLPVSSVLPRPDSPAVSRWRQSPALSGPYDM